jgi:hypothetical protein
MGWRLACAATSLILFAYTFLLALENLSQRGEAGPWVIAGLFGAVAVAACVWLLWGVVAKFSLHSAVEQGGRVVRAALVTMVVSAAIYLVATEVAEYMALGVMNQVSTTRPPTRPDAHDSTGFTPTQPSRAAHFVTAAWWIGSGG